VYGILLGGLLGGGRLRLRPVAVDYLFGLLLFAHVASAVATEHLYTGVSIFGSLLLQIVAPYFIARQALRDRATQRRVLRVLIFAVLVIAPFALVELRFFPNLYRRLMFMVRITEMPYEFAFYRFGLFRAVSSFQHPIDLGNSAGLLLAGIAILAVRSGVGLRDTWVRIGLAAALVSALAAMSFTTYFGLAAAGLLLLTLYRVPVSRRLLVPLVAVLIVLGFAYASYLAGAPLAEAPAGDSALAGSRWMRQLIIKRAWQYATTAGPLGWGGAVDVADLESVDNAYLVIAIQRGWLALALWLALPVCLASLSARALLRERTRSGTNAILLGFSAAIGTMVAMFTVWFGFVYASLFVIILGVTVDAAQRSLAVRRSRSRAAEPAPAAQPPASPA
jgi:hypothetical protein